MSNFIADNRKGATAAKFDTLYVRNVAFPSGVDKVNAFGCRYSVAPSIKNICKLLSVVWKRVSSSNLNAGRLFIIYCYLVVLGYKNILGTDYAKAMVQRARHISKLLEYSVPFRVADATDLKFEDDI